MDVVIFQIGEQMYGLNAEVVREIIDPVPVTPLPFVPPDVEGLINVSGSVMPQICAMRRLERGERLRPEEGVVMILLAGGCLSACRVSRMVAKVTADPGLITRTSMAESESRDALLAGEMLWNDTLVLLLDPDRLLLERTSVAVGDEEYSGLVSDTADDGSRRFERAHAREFPAIVFSCAGEQFALQFEDVAEVVEGGGITPLPGAPAELSGAMLLRGVPLPLLSLRSLLFGSVGAVTTYTLIVRLNGFRVGLQVERVLGIQRFACDSLQPLGEGQSTLLSGFVTTPDERMVALLRLASLAAADRFDAWRPWMIADNDDSRSADGGAAAAVRTRRLLLFRAGRELLALPLETVERVEEYFDPTDTPADQEGAVCGVIQVQGNIIPVRSLERVIGRNAAVRSGAYLIISGRGGRCAVPVEKVERVFEMAESVIEPVHSGKNSCLSGIGKYHGTLVSLLDNERLAA